MFDGRVDDAYVADRRTGSEVHDWIDLDAHWYVAMYKVVRRLVSECVAGAGATRDEREAFAAAFARLVQVDVALVVTALTDLRRHRVETMADEQTRFLAETGTVLDALAARDRRPRMTSQFLEEPTGVECGGRGRASDAGRGFAVVAAVADASAYDAGRRRDSAASGAGASTTRTDRARRARTERLTGASPDAGEQLGRDT